MSYDNLPPLPGDYEMFNLIVPEDAEFTDDLYEASRYAVLLSETDPGFILARTRTGNRSAIYNRVLVPLN